METRSRWGEYVVVQAGEGSGLGRYGEQMWWGTCWGCGTEGLWGSIPSAEPVVIEAPEAVPGFKSHLDLLQTEGFWTNVPSLRVIYLSWKVETMVIPSKAFMLSDEIIDETHLKLCLALSSTNICKILSLLICYSTVIKIKNPRLFLKTSFCP